MAEEKTTPATGVNHFSSIVSVLARAGKRGGRHHVLHHHHHHHQHPHASTAVATLAPLRPGAEPAGMGSRRWRSPALQQAISSGAVAKVTAGVDNTEPRRDGPRASLVRAAMQRSKTLKKLAVNATSSKILQLKINIHALTLDLRELTTTRRCLAPFGTVGSEDMSPHIRRLQLKQKMLPFLGGKSDPLTKGMAIGDGQQLQQQPQGPSQPGVSEGGVTHHDIMRRNRMVRARSWLVLIKTSALAQLAQRNLRARSHAASVIQTAWFRKKGAAAGSSTTSTQTPTSLRRGADGHDDNDNTLRDPSSPASSFTRWKKSARGGSRTGNDSERPQLSARRGITPLYVDEITASLQSGWMKPKVLRAYQRQHDKRILGWIFPCVECTSKTWRLAYHRHGGRNAPDRPVYLCAMCMRKPEFFKHFSREREDAHFFHHLYHADTVNQQQQQQEQQPAVRDEDEDNIKGLRRSLSMNDVGMMHRFRISGSARRRLQGRSRPAVPVASPDDVVPITPLSHRHVSKTKTPHGRASVRSNSKLTPHGRASVRSHHSTSSACSSGSNSCSSVVHVYNM